MTLGETFLMEQYSDAYEPLFILFEYPEDCQADKSDGGDGDHGLGIDLPARLSGLMQPFGKRAEFGNFQFGLPTDLAGFNQRIPNDLRQDPRDFRGRLGAIIRILRKQATDKRGKCRGTANNEIT
jgi:hypothetical protein